LVNQQARNDSRSQHVQSSTKFFNSCAPQWWLFSGWH
jgi:hypothetical protein